MIRPETHIAGGEVFAFRLGMRTTFRTSRGVMGDERSGRTVVLAKLTADDGTSGWGEASPIVTWSPETVEASVAEGRQIGYPSANSATCIGTACTQNVWRPTTARRSTTGAGPGTWQP
ncbi:MAG TPA: hypothetical protein VIU62_00535 [Chloroflexota bacterium]|jgi:L-alanine-DL-glutamate epimerase-like enolase superfamily enzyme